MGKVFGYFCSKTKFLKLENHEKEEGVPGCIARSQGFEECRLEIVEVTSFVSVFFG